jgi:hypothetical protein
MNEAEVNTDYDRIKTLVADLTEGDQVSIEQYVAEILDLVGRGGSLAIIALAMVSSQIGWEEKDATDSSNQPTN